MEVANPFAFISNTMEITVWVWSHILGTIESRLLKRNNWVNQSSTGQCGLFFDTQLTWADRSTAGLLQTRTSAKAQRGTLSLGVAGSQVWIGSKRWIEMVGLSSSQPVAVLMTQTFLIRTGDVSKPIKSLYFRGNKQPWAMNQIHQRYFRLPSGCHPGAIRVPGF